MKNKLNCLIMLFLFQTLLFSQSKTFQATYSIKVIENERIKNAPDDMKQILHSQDRIAENLTPILYFNDSISEYRLNENVLEGKLAKALYCNCLKPIYTNSNKNIVFYNNYTLKAMNDVYAKEDQYLILDTLVKNWKLTSESKYIQNYKVYKAIKELKFEITQYSTKSSSDIIAWYCPEIPYSFGPKGYFGLPGLIMELQDENCVVGITSLKENKDFNFSYQKVINTGEKISKKILDRIIENKHPYKSKD